MPNTKRLPLRWYSGDCALPGLRGLWSVDTAYQTPEVQLGTLKIEDKRWMDATMSRKLLTGRTVLQIEQRL